MITAINSQISGTARQITDTKLKLREIQGKVIKQAQDEVGVSPEHFLSELEGLTNTPIEILNRAQNTYNKYVGLTDAPKQRIQGVRNQVVGIKDKLQGIIDYASGTLLSTIETINTVLGIFEDLIIALEAALASSSGPLANGALIDKIGNIKRDIQDLIFKFNQATGNALVVFVKFVKLAKRLLEPVGKILAFIDLGIAKIEKIQTKLYSYWGQFIVKMVEKLGIADELQDVGGAIIDIREYVQRGPDALKTIVQDLLHDALRKLLQSGFENNNGEENTEEPG